LALPHHRVEATPGEQLVMAALLDHATVVEHQDLVGIDHGREAMRDDQDGAPRRKRPRPMWRFRRPAPTSDACKVNRAQGKR
jgi:hypothetical protein